MVTSDSDVGFSPSESYLLSSKPLFSSTRTKGKRNELLQLFGLCCLRPHGTERWWSAAARVCLRRMPQTQGTVRPGTTNLRSLQRDGEGVYHSL